MPFYTGGRSMIYKDKSFYYTRLRLFFFYLASVGLLGAISLLGFVTLDIYSTLQSLDKNGATSQGQLISHRIQSATKSTTYYLTYSYTVPVSSGFFQTYQTQRQVNAETYKRLAVGSQLQVRYLPSHPEVSRLVEVTEDNFQFDKNLLVLAVLAFVEMYLIHHIITGHRVRAKKRLAEACRN